MRTLRTTSVALSAVVALVLIGCGGGDKGGDKGGDGKGGNGGAKGDPLKPEITVAAVEFAKEFATDEKAATAKYKGKVVELEGLVESANQVVSKGAFVLTGFKKDKKTVIPTNIMCFVPATKLDAVVLLGKGQKVKVIGKFADVVFMPRLMECDFTELSKSPTPTVTAVELTKEYAKDKDAAAKRYGNTEVIVEGKVEDLPKVGDRLYVKLTGDGKLHVHFPIDDNEAKLYPKGATVRVKGDISPFGFDGTALGIDSAFLLKSK